ncbi:MFS transporter [Streptomyces sp. CB02923]|uniref:MFS transporter n=1 Tax=Streptomyces sp. CB02923 TaxID=1718985 RepID=UPI00093E5E8D|nr:MFS transporter [Streptomyces sp. CB02923]OKI01444.1 MFS transporter [Streptomyces sp. CB02923]
MSESTAASSVGPPERRLRTARAGTFAAFALNGFVMGMWIVHIPAIEHRVGITHAVLGWLLLFLGVGAFAGMQVCGALADRFGSRNVVLAGGALCSATVVLPGLADSPWTLAAALLALGFGNGCLDVSMNTQAVQVERGYGRPVMSAFHAVFSVGGVIAALIGARTISWEWRPALTLTGVAVAGVLITLALVPGLLPPESPAPATTSPKTTATPAAAAPKRRTPSQVWALGVLAFMLMLCEGVANDWSVLHLKDVLDAPAATAALAYGGFSTAMTVGRFATDRVVTRFGRVSVVRYGAGLGALGLAVASLSPWVPLALLGWALFGIGLSGCIPQFFTAAGNVDPASSGANVSRVAGMGYVGMLAGPAVIGPLTHLVPLNLTFFLPVAFCAAAACAAGILRPARGAATAPEPARAKA